MTRLLSGQISPAVFRRLKQTVGDSVLGPQGFRRLRNGSYFRFHAGQVQALFFQHGRWSREFTFNLCIHPEFVPGCCTGGYEWESWSEVDFVARARVGEFLTGRDTWWQLDGLEKGAAADLLTQSLSKAVPAFDTEILKDPQQLLVGFSPATLAAVVSKSNPTSDDIAREMRKVGTIIGRAWGIWFPEYQPFLLSLAAVARFLKRDDLAEEYQRFAARWDDRWAGEFRSLKKRMRSWARHKREWLRKTRD